MGEIKLLFVVCCLWFVVIFWVAKYMEQL